MTTNDSAKSGSIFIVDDDESVRSFLSFSLKSEGFQIDTAKSAEEALTKLKKNVPDLILLDIMLPEMNGYAMCKVVRADDRLKKVPVVFITAYADKDSLKIATEVGAQGFLEKPVMFDELMMQVLEAMAGHFSMPTRLKFAA